MKVSTLNHPFFSTLNTHDSSESLVQEREVSTPVKWQLVWRKIGAVFFASIITFGLLVLMQSLIDSDLPEPQATKKIIVTGLFDIPVDSPVPDKKPIEKIDEPQLPPPINRFNPVDIAEEGLIGVIDMEVEATPVTGLTFGDNTAVRLVAVRPEYPRAAISREIEGYVEVRFDITPAGTTENAEIIAFKPSKVFNRSALRAVARWRYQPKVVGGKAVATLGHMERLTFQLEN